MKLGGVILASVGIIIVVLVGNGRWTSVWNAALGTSGSSGTTSGGSPVQSAASNTVGGVTATATYSS